MAVDGDTALIGAVFADTTDRPGQGAAYVFTRTGRTWKETTKLVAEDPGADEAFGRAVAVVGETAVVSAYRKPGRRGRGEGAVYVFRRSGTAWTQEAKLTSPDPKTMGYFGSAVSLHGERLAITEPGGAVAHLYGRSEARWTHLASLRASDAEPGDNFGNDVCLHAGTVLVGAYFKEGPDPEPKPKRSKDEAPPRWHQGAAYVFTPATEQESP